MTPEDGTATTADLATLAACLQRRLDQLERRVAHLQDDKVDATVVLDLILEQLRRARR
jgi:hypothetical protein